MVTRSETIFLKQRIEFEGKFYLLALDTAEELIKSQIEVTEHKQSKRTDVSDLGYYMYLKG